MTSTSFSFAVCVGLYVILSSEMVSIEKCGRSEDHDYTLNSPFWPDDSGELKGLMYNG